MPTTTNFGWTTPADTDLVKDGAAAIRTLGNGIDTSFLDLKGGTTGQVLAKASNTDLDFTWSSVDPLTILDAKGDLISATAADTPARLAVGANDTVLTADSSTATGLKWAAVNASALTLLNTGGTSIAGAQSTTVSAISGSYKNLHIYLENYYMGSGNDDIFVRLNGETGSNYREVRIERGDSATGTNGTSGTAIYISAAASSTQEGNFAYAVIPNYAATTHRKSLQGQGFYKDGGTNEYFIIWGGTRINSNDAITSITIGTGSGNNIGGGTLYIYGEK